MKRRRLTVFFDSQIIRTKVLPFDFWQASQKGTKSDCDGIEDGSLAVAVVRHQNCEVVIKSKQKVLETSEVSYTEIGEFHEWFDCSGFMGVQIASFLEGWSDADPVLPELGFEMFFRPLAVGPCRFQIGEGLFERKTMMQAANWVP